MATTKCPAPAQAVDLNKQGIKTPMGCPAPTRAV